MSRTSHEYLTSRPSRRVRRRDLSGQRGRSRLSDGETGRQRRANRASCCRAKLSDRDYWMAPTKTSLCYVACCRSGLPGPRGCHGGPATARIATARNYPRGGLCPANGRRSRRRPAAHAAEIAVGGPMAAAGARDGPNEELSTCCSATSPGSVALRDYHGRTNLSDGED